MKTDLINASLTAINDTLLYVVDIDASHNSVSVRTIDQLLFTKYIYKAMN